MLKPQKNHCPFLLRILGGILLLACVFGKPVATRAAVSFSKTTVTHDISEGSELSLQFNPVNASIKEFYSSNESVVETYSLDVLTGVFSLRVNGTGTATVTLIDSDDNTATCSVTVTAPDLVLEESSITAYVYEDNVSVGIKSGYGVTCESSDESVFFAYAYEEEGKCEIYPRKAGTATLTVMDFAGNKKTVPVTIKNSEWKLKTTSLTYYLSAKEPVVEFENVSSVDYIYSVMEEDAILDASEVYGADGKTASRLNLRDVGTITFVFTDTYYKEETCTITVKPDPLVLEETTIEGYLGDEDELKIKDFNWSKHYTYKSSDEKVVKVYDDEGPYLYFTGLGTATVTVSDDYGQSVTCTVKVVPYPASFGETAELKLENYPKDDPDGKKISFEEYSNTLTTVKSGDENIVKVAIGYYQIGNTGRKWDYLTFTPVAAGTTTITATDQYNQSATLKITISQKYIDEMAYSKDLQGTGTIDVEYGDTSIICFSSIDPTIYATIQDKKYTAKLNERGEYVISGVPVQPVGTQFEMTYQKGQAIVTETVTVGQKFGGSLKATIKDQTYTGKALTPAVTIKNGSLKLKAGTDYTVAYSKNKNVGKGTATITFQGNYKGAKVVPFNINPKGTSLTKPTALSKGFKVTWKKQATQTNGYEIQYSTKKNFKSDAKTVKITKAKTTSKNITNLKANTKYYVRIRTYKKSGKTTYYSTWSKVKNVKTKK